MQQRHLAVPHAPQRFRNHVPGDATLDAQENSPVAETCEQQEQRHVPDSNTHLWQHIPQPSTLHHQQLQDKVWLECVLSQGTESNSFLRYGLRVFVLSQGTADTCLSEALHCSRGALLMRQALAVRSSATCSSFKCCRMPTSCTWSFQHTSVQVAFYLGPSCHPHMQLSQVAEECCTLCCVYDVCCICTLCCVLMSAAPSAVFVLQLQSIFLPLKLAHHYFSQFQCNEALQVLSLLPASQRSSAGVLLLIGRCLYELVDYARAAEAFEAARAADPVNLEV